MATIGDVQAVAPSFKQGTGWAEQEGEFRINQPGSRVVTPYIVEWSERSAAIDAIYGVDETISVLGSSVTRRVPLKHHEFTWMYASSVRFADRGNTPTSSQQTHSLLHVTFEMPPWGDTGDLPYVEFRGSPAPRRVAAPASALYTTGGAYAEFDPNVQAAGHQFELVLHNLPSAFTALTHLALYQNKVNDNTFLNIYPADEVICDGPSWQASRTSGNVETWTIGVSFRWSPIKWNYEVVGTSFSEVFYGGTGNNADRRYPRANFNNIFAF